MTTWSFTIDIHEAWAKTNAGEISLIDLTTILASKLDDIIPKIKKIYGSMSYENLHLQEIIQYFKEYIETNNISANEFISLFNELHNWSDTPDKFNNSKKICLIKTNSETNKTQISANTFAKTLTT